MKKAAQGCPWKSSLTQTGDVRFWQVSAKLHQPEGGLQGMLCNDWWRGWGRLKDWVSVGWVKERS